MRGGRGVEGGSTSCTPHALVTLPRRASQPTVRPPPVPSPLSLPVQLAQYARLGPHTILTFVAMEHLRPVFATLPLFSEPAG